MFVNFLLPLWDWAFDFGAVGHPLYKCAMQSSLRYYEMNISKWACKDPCNDNATKKRFWSTNTTSFFSRLRSAPALGKVRAASHLRSPSPVFDLSFASCSVYSIKHSLSFVSLHFYILFSMYTIPTQKNYWGQAKPSVLPNDSLPIKTVFDLVWWVVVSLCNAIYVDVRNSIVKCKPLISYYIN